MLHVGDHSHPHMQQADLELVPSNLDFYLSSNFSKVEPHCSCAIKNLSHSAQKTVVSKAQEKILSD